MFKFIHAADIHLDSPLHRLDAYEGAPVEACRGATRRAFDNLVDLAVAEKAAFVVIAGDLYDGDWRDYNTGLYFVSRMARLRDAGIPVYIVNGNHDAASKITRSLRLPENVTVFSSEAPETVVLEKCNAALHGQSFATPVVRKNIARNYPSALPGLFNIGLLHTCAGGREGHEPYAPCSPVELAGKGYDYWALGHVHQREVLLEDPPVVFPGNTQGRHARETGPKGCCLVTVADGQAPRLTFQPLDVVRWTVVEVDAAGAQSGGEVIDRFSRRLEGLLEEIEGLPLAARVRIVGETAVHADLFADLEHWTNQIRAAAIDAGGGRVWVEKVGFETRLPLGKTLATARDGAVAELLRLFDELKSDPAACRELAGELTDLVKKVPREIRDDPEGLPLEDTAWITRLLQQVRPMLVRRLLRKGGAG